MENDDHRQRRLGLKLDAQRRWSYFPGVTVVCNVDAATRRRFEPVAQFIASQPTLSRYFVPLPASSLHVTIADVATRRGSSPAEWADLVRGRLGEWSQTAGLVNHGRSPVAPAVRLAQFFAPSARVLGFDVDFIEAGQRKAVEDLRNLVYKSAIRQYLPHCTLGYQYEAVPPSDVEAVRAELSQVYKHALGALLGAPDSSGHQGQPQPHLQLEAARFCWFSDMTEFRTWDADCVPELLVADRKVGQPILMEKMGVNG